MRSSFATIPRVLFGGVLETRKLFIKALPKNVRGKRVKKGKKGNAVSRAGEFFYRARPLLAQRKGREMIARAREANKPREKEKKAQQEKRKKEERTESRRKKAFRAVNR